MQLRGDRLLYSPKDLIQYLQSDFATWMERKAAQDPAVARPEPDEMQTVLTQLGDQHEKAYLESLRQAGTEFYAIETRGGFEATLAAMEAGKPLIYQGAIAHDNWLGYADFLVRVDDADGVRRGRSRFGSWHYAPVECKLAMNPKPYFILQACAYCELLEQLQGVRPRSFRLVLGSGNSQDFVTEDYFYYYRQVRRSFLAFMAVFDPDCPPAASTIGAAQDHGAWQILAEQMLQAADHLSLVANMTQSQIKKLEAVGIETVGALAIASPSQRVPKLDRQTYQKLQRQARLQQASLISNQPHYEVIPPPADQPSRGLASLPPASPLDVFFDMEGYPLAEGGAGLEYLFGATYVEPPEPLESSKKSEKKAESEADAKATTVLKFKAWWAHDPEMEQRAFEEFMDWIWQRWQRDPTLHIYHYAPYETAALKRLMGRYGSREEELDAMLRAGLFVDLYRVVSQGLCVGEASYSIKSLERFYWRKREVEVKNAQASVVQYFQWQQQRDGEGPEDSAILREIRDYNRDDCDSTKALADWLRSLQTQANIPYVPASADPPQPPEPPELTPAGQLAIELLSKPQADAAEPVLSAETRSLLAHLLQFHRREAKPFWWQRFTWLEAEETDLIDELDCLAGLERTDRMPFRPSARSKSWAYEYRVPDQETRLKNKTACWFVPSTVELKDCTLAELDLGQGTALLTLSDKKLETARTAEPNWEPGQRLSLIDVSVIPTKSIADAILETVQDWQRTGALQPALADFLERRSPRITHHPRGTPILQPNEDLLTGTLRAIAHLDHSTLCIQGPPGSGKTFTAAKIILNLLQQGKTVAVSANSHEVILNLLGRVQRYGEQVPELSKPERIKIAKVGGQREPVDRHPGIDYKAKGIEALPPDYVLVGATVFQLCRPEMVAQFDYLFVDEAGQVALANLLALARCAHNLVLIGDPMQLEQPIQGSHPGESGQSALGYLLNGRPTIPPDLGIFLDTTYRLGPALCQFISDSIYEGRLQHHPETHHHTLRFEPMGGQGWTLSNQSGIAFVGVEHLGNSQASAEEAEAIAALIQQLLGVEYVGDRGQTQGRLSHRDILIVAPYNLQVRQLQDRLGETARVGTVDKFQGQEAPVVIISMSASSAEDAPRGIEFLLNRNRLNVAVSRAQCLAIVVASPAIATAPCTTLEQMMQVNLFCKLTAGADRPEPGSYDA